MQRPDVARLVHTDLRAMAWLAPHLVGRIPVAALANPPALVELFADTIVEELDFRVEAANMLDVAIMLRDLEQRGYVVPRPHPRLVTRRVLVMERLDGFKFDDVAGMRQAGVDTEGVVRTAMVALLEGAMVEGVFHGDLHGGNLFVRPDGRTALLDFGIVARLSDERRLAFLRLMLGATTNDLMGQMAALRDLGALPLDTDLRAVIRDLGLDQAPVDPTTLTGDQLVKEVQRVVKALLGYGARLPKELMLYVKNLVFLDGAIARLAPDLDILAEIGTISLMFAQRHGERLGRELGIDPMAMTVDLDGVKAGFGLDPTRRAPDPPRPASPPRPHPAPHAPPPLIRARAAGRVAGVRVVVARCSVDYDGRLSAHLPEAAAADHGQGRRVRGRARRRRRLQAAQLDERAEHAGRGAGPLDDHQPEGRAPDDHAPRGAGRHQLGPRRRPRAAEGRRRGAPPGAARRQPARHRGGPAPRAPRVPDGDRADRPGVPRRRRRRSSPSR